MSAARRTIQNYAKLMRISNLPTCLANVLTGAAIGMQFQQPSIAKLVSLVFVICCYYCGGMILNDLCDIKYDKAHRPDRSIVTGDISFRNAVIVTVSLFVLPTVILFFVAAHALPLAAALLACIILYDLLHKKIAFSVVFMGACRALVYIVSAVTVADPSQFAAAIKASLPFAVIIGFYTLSITIVARMENRSIVDWRKWLSIAMPMAVFAILFFERPTHLLYALTAVVALAGCMFTACWFVFTNPPLIKLAVLTWLSGMCIVDAWFLIVLEQPLLAIIPAICSIITMYGHKKISGT